MTLIAAFRCAEGIVICADSQETVGGVPVGVTKLAPYTFPHYEVAIAGSGNGDLIEAFIYKLRLDADNWKAGLDERATYGYIRALLHDFHENEIENYPSSTNDKLNRFLICVKPKNSLDTFLWELRGSVIVPVKEHTLLGVDESIYIHELQRLYKNRISKAQAITLGVHLFSLAKATSTYIGGPTQIVFVGDGKMEILSAGKIDDLERRMARINGVLGNVMLEMSNFDDSGERAVRAFHLFQQEILGLRDQVSGISGYSGYSGHSDAGARFTLIAREAGTVGPPLPLMVEAQKKDEEE